MNHAESISLLINAKAHQVDSAIALLDSGDTVPFIARYRKEATGGLDDTQLRNLEERLQYLRDLDARRETIINTIKEQGKLTESLKSSLLSAETKTRLEDLYLPFKKKRQTKAQIARDAGLEPLLDKILENPRSDELVISHDFINSVKGFDTAESCLDGARQIAIETISENADIVQSLRDLLGSKGRITSKINSGKEAVSYTHLTLPTTPYV